MLNKINFITMNFDKYFKIFKEIAWEYFQEKFEITDRNIEAVKQIILYSLDTSIAL